jgi:predicted negative regulator of RcsB-dependent stress response
MTIAEYIGTFIGILSLLTVVFTFGYNYKSLKDKPSNSKVYEIFQEKISEHKKNCDFYPNNEGVKLDQKVADMKESIGRIETTVNNIYSELMSRKG